MKTHLNLNVDLQLINLAKSQRLNMSEILTNALRVILVSNSCDHMQQKIELQEQINELEAKLIELKTELDIKKVSLNAIKQTEKQTSLVKRKKVEKFATAMKNAGVLNEIMD